MDTPLTMRLEPLFRAYYSRPARAGVNALIRILLSLDSGEQCLLAGVGATQRKVSHIVEAVTHHSVYFGQRPKTPLNKYEFKVYSQNGEDGILLYLVSKIGATTRTLVEFGCGSGRECNSANLLRNFGWNGLLMDIDDMNVRDALEYYEDLVRRRRRIAIAKHRINAENINQVLTEHGMRGEIDLLSIDIDGNDYWVWKAVNQITPRIVVIEYNASLGYDEAITVKYDPSFDRLGKSSSGLYHGASLQAMKELGHSKGYALLGCDSSGANAFFVRRELLTDALREVSVVDGYYPNARRSRTLTPDQQQDIIRRLDFEHI